MRLELSSCRPRFWYQLQALGKGKGQRLVLPAEAAAYLPSILAMEKPEFFFDYEVLLASDFKQLLDLTAKKPKEPLASATAKFREIRERAGISGCPHLHRQQFREAASGGDSAGHAHPMFPRRCC